MLFDEHGRRIRRRLKVGFIREYVIESEDSETGDSYTYAVSANRIGKQHQGAEAEITPAPTQRSGRVGVLLSRHHSFLND
jgi:outer membrane receptor for Fe3+-dicitrate